MFLIKSNYDKNTGESYCLVWHNSKIYKGIARLHDEDKDNASSFTGCKIAEFRAKVKALKEEKAEAKKELHACEKFVKTLTNHKNFDQNTKEYGYIKKALWQRQEKIKQLEEEILHYENMIFTIPIQRDIVLKAIERKKNKNS